ncbi:hypothetical protein D3C87_1726680 [compost metagenome]
MRKVIVAARAEALAVPLGIDGQHVRMLVDHPARWRGGRRADDHLKVVAAEHVHRPDHPVELNIARSRFKPRPGKLADAHDADAELGHAGRVRLPHRLGPVFRIVADAEGRDGHVWSQSLILASGRPAMSRSI